MICPKVVDSKPIIMSFNRCHQLCESVLGQAKYFYFSVLFMSPAYLCILEMWGECVRLIRGLRHFSQMDVAGSSMLTF